MKGVWWHNDDQKAIVNAKIEDLEATGVNRKVVSFHGPVGKLFRAEEYHQRYFEKQGR